MEKRAEAVPLTPQERDLLSLVLWGRNASEIADALGMSVPEVQALLERLQARFGVTSRRALMVRAWQQGWNHHFG